MQKKGTFFAIFSVIFLSIFCIALAGTFQGSGGVVANQEGGGETSQVDCFSYFKPNSVLLKINTQTRDLTPGEELKGTVLLRNESGHPISGGDVFLQIWRQAEKPGSVDILVAEFFPTNGVALNVGQESEYSFVWKTPKGISSGKYLIGGHFVINRKIYVSGIPFNDGSYFYDAVRMPVIFNIRSASAPNEVVLSRDTFLVGNKKLPLKGAPLQFSNKDNSLEVAIMAKNLSSKEQTFKIKKRVYSWDNLKESNLFIESAEESIKVAGLAQTRVGLKVNDLRPGAYLAEFVAQSESGVQTIAKARFIINGADPNSRIVYMGLSSFPLMAGDKASIFNCFQTMTADLPLAGKVVLSLTDGNNRVLQKVAFEGSISKNLVGVKNDFVATSKMDDLTLTATIYDKSNAVIDEQIIRYQCSLFDKELKEIIIETPKNGQGNLIKVYAINSCGQSVTANISLEVLDQNGKSVFLKEDVVNNSLEARPTLKTNTAYTVNARINNLTAKKDFVSVNPGAGNIWYVILIVLILVVFGGIVWAILRKNNKV